MFSKVDQEQVESVVLFIRLETIKKYVPMGMTVLPNGGVTIDGTIIITRLFSYPPQEKLMLWLQQGKFFLSLPTIDPKIDGGWVKSPSDAARSVAKGLLDRGLSMERLKRLNYYIQISNGTEDALRAYLVVAGIIPNVSSHVLVGRLEP